MWRQVASRPTGTENTMPPKSVSATGRVDRLVETCQEAFKIVNHETLNWWEQKLSLGFAPETFVRCICTWQTIMFAARGPATLCCATVVMAKLNQHMRQKSRPITAHLSSHRFDCWVMIFSKESSHCSLGIAYTGWDDTSDYGQATTSPCTTQYLFISG